MSGRFESSLLTNDPPGKDPAVACRDTGEERGQDAEALPVTDILSVSPWRRQPGRRQPTNSPEASWS